EDEWLAGINSILGEGQGLRFKEELQAGQVLVSGGIAMTTFLFWNLGGRRLEPVLRRLTARHEIDVLMLAECAIPEDSMLKALNAVSQGTFRRIPALASRGLDLYSRFDPSCFGSVLKEADHYLIR